MKLQLFLCVSSAIASLLIIIYGILADPYHFITAGVMLFLSGTHFIKYKKYKAEIKNVNSV